MTAATLTYFYGRGRAETTRWMLAATDVDFRNNAIRTPQELAALRESGKLPFDQMPLLEIDGHRLSQSSAMVRYLARRGNLYGNNVTDAMWCDLVSGVAADFAEVAIQAAFKPDAATAVGSMEACFLKFGPRFESRIAQQGSGFCAADSMTFADVVLAEALSSYLEWCPDLLSNKPHLSALYDTVTNHRGVAGYLASNLRYPQPGDEYVIAVAQVLQRALPPHMPNPDRFLTR